MHSDDALNELMAMGRQDDQIQDAPHADFTLRTKVIQHPDFVRAIREIARIHFRWRKTGVAEGLMLHGQSGSGKTTLLEFYAQRFPMEFIETRSDRGTERRARIPILRVVTPESPTVKTLAEAFLEAMDDVGAGTGSANLKTKRIKLYMDRCQVELILVDEFHHFVERRQAAEASRVADWLKNLFNDCKRPVVLVGLPRAIMVLNGDTQLRRRFASPFYLPPFGFSTEEEQILFRALLQQFEEMLPHSPRNTRANLALSEPGMARRFYFASNGLIDYVVKILDDAASRRGAGLEGALTQADLALAFRNQVWRDAPDQLNPFHPDAILRPLTHLHEPFAGWDDPHVYTQSPGTRPLAKKAGRGRPTVGSKRDHGLAVTQISAQATP